ncbi:MAG: hypothetical protein KDA88_10910 [Planctomycetaceae bacterium]|nr:hypothetical protein [Planctomycetaceae bacterium]MCB9949923.1 hypothetical protein [Planctomycetaceae bacterium]
MLEPDEYLDDEIMDDPVEVQPQDFIDEPPGVIRGQSDVAGQTTDSNQGRVFPCESCGADLEFSIGQQTLKCPYCGHEKEIEIREDAEIVEQDFHAMLAYLEERRRSGAEAEEEEAEHNEVRCRSCGADVVFLGTLTSTTCPYCASPIQRENVHTATFRVPVDGVLPFLVERRKAHSQLASWVKSLWFAPNKFLKEGAQGQFEGVYLPYWTFDTLTFSQYSGQRGINYTTTTGVGKNRRTVTRTRWYSVSGQFQRFFDDVLVVASEGLPEKYVQGLEPWPLEDCIPFTQQVLAGHFARTYDVELDEGFVRGKERIDAAIDSEVRQRIGGDKQRVDNIKSRYDAITFKHLLLPVWMLVYRYNDKPFRVFINAATGEVQGERPYSWVKIMFTVLGVLAIVGTIAFFASR